jgi:outer membrane lipoprotein-sorting protein
MKNILLGFLLLLPIGISAQPQNNNRINTQTLLQRFLGKMTTGPVAMTFTFTYENTPKKIKEVEKGTVVYSGQQFHLQIGVLNVYCDGISKWICNDDIQEVTVYAAEENMDMTQNPLNYLLTNKDNFRHRPVRHEVKNGQKLLALDLLPKEKNAPYILVGLLLDEETLELVQVLYKMKGGQRYLVDVEKIDTNVAVKAFSFVFPKSSYAGYAINDMRE